MAQIDFYTGGNGSSISSLGGSGLGFFGAGGFGASVSVAAYQSNTYITNSNGTLLGPQGNNVMWSHSASGTLPTNVLLPLTSIPNGQSTLNVRFSNATAVKTQNAKAIIYDSSNINNGPSGVTCAVAHIIHPNAAQVTGGSGSAAWSFLAGSSVTLNMSQFGGGGAFSPGISGLSPSGGNTTDIQHDWYLAISASPNSIGSKQFSFYVSLEYL